MSCACSRDSASSPWIAAYPVMMGPRMRAIWSSVGTLPLTTPPSPNSVSAR